MITRKEKEGMGDQIARELEQAELIIATDYRGLNVAALNDLRRQLKAEQCKYKITKNTLTRLACRKARLEALEPLLEGPTALAYTSADPVAAARVFLKFTKENEILNIKGGLLDGQALPPSQIKALGEIPPREVLLSQICRGFQAPIYGLASVLHGNLRRLVYALDAVRRQKETA